MSARLTPLPMTTIVTTDLIGITRGRSFPTDELEHYQAAGCGWVPANSALTPQDVIASTNPWGAYGDLRLIPDLSSRVTVGNGPEADAPALDFIHGDIRETDGRPWGACPRTLLRDEIERYRDVLGLQVNAAFEHEFNLHAGFAEHLAFSSKPSVRAQNSAAGCSAPCAPVASSQKCSCPNTASINTKSPAARPLAWRRQTVR